MYCTLYLYGLVTVTNIMVATLQYARMYVFTAYINLSVHNRQVLRLMYRIHTHIHYIISYQELITYRTKTLSPLSNIPCLCIVASYTAIYIPLILVCGSVPRSHRGKLFQYVIYRFVLPTLQTYGVFD